MPERSLQREPAGVRAIAAIFQDVEEVCTLLTSPAPETLDRCERILKDACSSFGGFLPERAELPGLYRLQSAIRQAGQLLDAAFQYHDLWRLRLRTNLAGYGPGGHPAAISHQSRVFLEG